MTVKHGYTRMCVYSNLNVVRHKTETDTKCNARVRRFDELSGRLVNELFNNNVS